MVFYEGGVYGHEKDHTEKSISIFNGSTIANNNHGQPTNTLIPSVTHPPNSSSSSSLVSSERQTSTPSPNMKVISLGYIYEIIVVQAHEKNPRDEIVHFALFSQDDFEPSCYEDACTNQFWV